MISPDEVRHLATLARLELSDPEAAALAAELGSILEHMEALRRVPPLGDEPVPGEPEPGAPLRPDRVGFDPLQRPPAAIAPAWRDGLFVVPRLRALDAQGGEEAE